MNAGWAVALILPLTGCIGDRAPLPFKHGYHCESGAILPVLMDLEADGTLKAVVTVDGHDYTLLKEDGVGPGNPYAWPPEGRFSWPSDGSNYVWQINRGIGTLLWHDGTTNTEVQLEANCRAHGRL